MPYYWISAETDRPLSPGDVVPKTDPIFGTTAKVVTERTLEEVRSSEFPSLPSRKNANYVVDSLEDVKIWQKWWFGEDSDVYEVSVNGTTFKADGSIVMEINDAFLSEREHALTDPSKAAQYKKKRYDLARKYWSGESLSSEPEIIVQGSVVVVKKIEQVTESTVGKVRSIIRSLLAEAVCPACGQKDAYIGLNDVECINKLCKNYSQKQLMNVMKRVYNVPGSVDLDAIMKKIYDIYVPGDKSSVEVSDEARRYSWHCVDVAGELPHMARAIDQVLQKSYDSVENAGTDLAEYTWKFDGYQVIARSDVGGDKDYIEIVVMTN